MTVATEGCLGQCYSTLQTAVSSWTVSLLALKELVQSCETIILLKFFVARISLWSKQCIDKYCNASFLPHRGQVTNSLWTDTLNSVGPGQVPRHEGTISRVPWQCSPAADSWSSWDEPGNSTPPGKVGCILRMLMHCPEGQSAEHKERLSWDLQETQTQGDSLAENVLTQTCEPGTSSSPRIDSREWAKCLTKGQKTPWVVSRPQSTERKPESWLFQVQGTEYQPNPT